MPSAPSSLTPLRRRLNALRALIESVCNPYRPEQHYMRGRGPKWRARHELRKAD